MSWQQLFMLELKAIFSDRALLLTVFGGVIFYSFLYPLPYSQQLPRDQQVVIVDLDSSALSRKLIRMVNATPEVRVNRYVSSIGEAQQAIVEDGLAGMMVIPKHFYRDLLLNKTPTLSYAGDASYFLVYSKVAKGLATAGATLAAEIKVLRDVAMGQALVAAKKQHTAIGLNLRPVFNTTTGYINYIVPAVFVLILHQTLLIGVGLLGGTQNEKTLTGHPGYWINVPSWKLVFTRAFIFLLIYLVLSIYYFGFCFRFYGISTLAKPLELIQLIIPFILATGLVGICISQLLPRRELATLLVLLTSLPIVFSAGFVWPTNMLPTPLLYASQLIPAIPGIQAFLQLNQMGAEFYQIRGLWLQLWLQVIVYGVIASLLVGSKANLKIVAQK
ncbi:Efflux ABC transporter, permease protein [hydrothermal vent metagenome]|uniref:Efflux ABC transporter, permease protein n=1 Tax=hydrothermal vent metagenome TaxID=652676 RepID=A0A3B0Y8R9_9ZZZZ